MTECKGNKKDKFNPFLGSIWWKTQSSSVESKTVRVDELSKLTNNRVVFFWKKELPNFVLSATFTYQYYKGKNNF